MKKTIGRRLKGGAYIEITATFRDEGHDWAFPGFSITAELWERRGYSTGCVRARYGREPDRGGQITDEIRQVAPELQPLLVVHLADPDGTPIHAATNGWYFYSGAAEAYELKHYGQAYVDRAGSSHDRAAEALHIHPGELPVGMDMAAFRAFAATLTNRWAEQARVAREVLEAMVDGDGVIARDY